MLSTYSKFSFKRLRGMLRAGFSPYRHQPVNLLKGQWAFSASQMLLYLSLFGNSPWPANPLAHPQPGLPHLPGQVTPLFVFVTRRCGLLLPSGCRGQPKTQICTVLRHSSQSCLLGGHSSPNSVLQPLEGAGSSVAGEVWPRLAGLGRRP